ncbi:MAG: DNA repair protein RadA [Clostridia bacterium]|nr:DNA repair protein RadA [Clostridia bacterium]
MSKNTNKTMYVCTECGYDSPKWYGQCPACKQWNTMEEIKVTHSASSGATVSALDLTAQPIDQISITDEHRYLTGMKELDRVLGGGIVQGSLILLGGDPGIGKSTLLLQICEFLGKKLKVLYVSGEESAHQIKLRANRLNVYTENLFIMTQKDILAISDYVAHMKPDIVMIDSIQTMVANTAQSSAGSVSQIRECTNILMNCAKNNNIPIFIVGHVNKDGDLAGPKILEHMVDAVLYFEGDKQLAYRILRAAKNRFGSTNEIGVFEMGDTGLREVENPSLMLISGRPKGVSGTCIACVMEGTRPIFAEVQGLAAPTNFGNPRRMATGFDYNRMNMLIAVLEMKAGYFFGNMDTYVNVIGGLKLDEPAADISVALALVSSLKDQVVPDDVITFGEVGLVGEVRSVVCCEQRVSEAARLGFARCIIPKNNLKNISAKLKNKIEIIAVDNVRDAFEALLN